MSSRVRIGAVNYLNTKPLIHNLDALAPHAELELDTPSRLAERLAAGELDVALIPVVEHIRSGTYSIVPDISIAACGPVLSVTLFSRTPWTQIRRVALDAGSRTSAALTEVLLRARYNMRAESVPLPMDANPESVDADVVRGRLLRVVLVRAHPVGAARHPGHAGIGRHGAPRGRARRGPVHARRQ